MNTTIEISELRTFTAVVSHGTFTAAAENLDTDKAHVSRIITRLEQKLGARLLERSTRRLSVTEIGRDVYERANGVLLALEETENSVARSHSTPTGTLKLTAGPEFGALVVNQWIAEYLRTFPDVTVEAEFTNRVVDIIHEGFDVAIRVGSLSDSELSARKLGEIEYRFYASPRYSQKCKQPNSPNDLTDHPLITFAPRGNPVWKIVSDRDSLTLVPTPKYAVNNNQAAMGMVIEGIGISLLPSFIAAPAARNGTLETILPKWKRIPVPVHAVFPSSRYMAPKVRAFVDLAIKKFKIGCERKNS